MLLGVPAVFTTLLGSVAHAAFLSRVFDFPRRTTFNHSHHTASNPHAAAKLRRFLVSASADQHPPPIDRLTPGHAP